ncbi:hypothetical protein [Allorhizocola rhizosphaerae]|uniref:hypothetical protein n=1 Tax=Allorhizocola rhizosphaerae TaxID=1872709 RepID=UPI000E3D34C2|nr:hypothetical protein [Allorhizocola rhizosphaerae]
MTAWVNRLARVTAVPLVLRGIVFAAAWLGLWLAVPSPVASLRVALLLVVVALVPALIPGTRVVDGVMLAIVALWVVSTLMVGQAAEPVHTFMTGAALYLTHSAAAFAAVLPYDSVVDAQVVVRWAARSVFVLAAAGVVTAVVVLFAPMAGQTTSVVALFAGLGIVVALIALLARRRG